MTDRRHARERPPEPLAEWVVGALGAVLLLASFAVIVWEAATSDRSPPQVELRVLATRASGGMHLVEVRATNHGGTTAAGLEIEGELQAGGKVERSRAQLQFLPAHSHADVGLFFRGDPRSGRLMVRPLGYSDP